MIPVTIADVIKQEHRPEEQDQTLIRYVVLLLDEEGNRVLPIWVGPPEGQAITAGLREVQFLRPPTFDFIARLLQAADVTLEAVYIDRLEDTVFYATVRLNNGVTTREIDARPSDALALATRMNTPIYAAQDIFDSAGAEIPESAQLHAAGKGIDDIVQELEAMVREVREQVSRPGDKVAVARIRQELLATVFDVKE